MPNYVVVLGGKCSVPIMRVSATVLTFLHEHRSEETARMSARTVKQTVYSVKDSCLYTAFPEISLIYDWTGSVFQSKNGGVHPFPILLMHSMLLGAY
jgi:hypothetical protein